MTIFRWKYEDGHKTETCSGYWINIQTSAALDGNPEPDLVHATGCKQPTSSNRLYRETELLAANLALRRNLCLWDRGPGKFSVYEMRARLRPAARRLKKQFLSISEQKPTVPTILRWESIWFCFVIHNQFQGVAKTITVNIFGPFFFSISLIYTSFIDCNFTSYRFFWATQQLCFSNRTPWNTQHIFPVHWRN
jgi:hypothetical protein